VKKHGAPFVFQGGFFWIHRDCGCASKINKGVPLPSMHKIRASMSRSIRLSGRQLYKNCIYTLNRPVHQTDPDVQFVVSHAINSFRRLVRKTFQGGRDIVDKCGMCAYISSLIQRRWAEAFPTGAQLWASRWSVLRARPCCCANLTHEERK